MTIRGRIFVLGALGVMVLALALLQFYRLLAVNAGFSDEWRQAAAVNHAVQRLDLLAFEYLLYHESRPKRQLAMQREILVRQTHGFAGSADPHRLGIALKLGRIVILLEAMEGEPPVAGPPSARIRFLAEQLTIASQEMFEHARSWKTQVQVAREGLLRESALSAVIASGCMVILLAVVARFLVRTIFLPVERLRVAVAAVARGDFNHQLTVARNDEMGVLTADFNQMAAALAAAASEREETAEIKARSVALERVNHDLEHFATLASHDLQAPLRSVNCFTELIKNRAGSLLDARSNDHLQRVIDATERMQALINSLLRFARAGSVDVSLDTKICARAALNQALENLSVPVQESEAHLDIGDLPAVRFDGIQLSQIFQNVIGNAIKYRDPTRPLHVRVWSGPGPDGFLTMAVADNGPGIREEKHDHIFGMFQRAHGSEIPGSGIGLALCRRILENRGGSIRVESVVGQGATFLFTVPAASG